MQHDRVLKKMNFDLLSPSVMGAGGAGVCGFHCEYSFLNFKIKKVIAKNQSEKA